MILYHFTCEHGALGILNDKMLNPGPLGLLWLTDLDSAPRDALGLTSHTLDCDRMTHRFTVVTEDAQRWHLYRRTMSGEARHWAEILERANGAMPAHWWVSTEPIPWTG